MKAFIKRVIYVALVLVLLVLFSFFVWPTQWRDLPLKAIGDQQFHQRQNRFTGEVETWVPDSTVRINRQPVFSYERGTWTKEF
jgi:hypothetical protein